MIKIAKGAEREVENFMLTRYACYFSMICEAKSGLIIAAELSAPDEDPHIKLVEALAAYMEEHGLPKEIRVTHVFMEAVFKELAWYARELQSVLAYSQWRYFLAVISKAQEACESSGNMVEDHFAEVRKMVSIGSGAEREIEDFMLTRYACYLIVMNGDPRKEVIALGQTYFAPRKSMLKKV